MTARQPKATVLPPGIATCIVASVRTPQMHHKESGSHTSGLFIATNSGVCAWNQR